MLKFLAKFSALLMLGQVHKITAQECFSVSSMEVNDSFAPEHMPDIMGALDAYNLSAVNPYITKPATCALTTTAKANIGNVEFISIDTVPNSFKYLKYIKYQISIANGSGVENKYCNPHCDETMGGALGVNAQGIPALQNIKVNFDPALICIGNGYEPYLVLAIQEAIKIATANAAQGKTTITTYSIGGTYNTLEKIDAMRQLTEIPGSFVVTVIGNNLGQYDNCASPFFTRIPKLFIIGGTQNGDQLSRYTMVGACVKYYAPARYISPVTQKLNEGVSFAGPIVAYLIANFKLNNPGATRDQIDQHLLSLTDAVTRVSAQGQSVTMNIFRQKTVCNVEPVPTPAPTPAPTPLPTATHRPTKKLRRHG